MALDDPQFHLTNLDAVAFLSGLPAESVALVITDPPYESLEKHRAIGTTTRLKNSRASSNAWFDIFPNARFEELFAQLYRVLSQDTHLYFFCDAETMFVVKPVAERCGFRFWKPLIWDKQKLGMGYHYRARYELILFFEKGKRRLNDLSVADVLSAPRISGGYPTEKPVELSETMVRSKGLCVCGLGDNTHAIRLLSSNICWQSYRPPRLCPRETYPPDQVPRRIG
jgi:site-specific DNA-methyltransferase (adenine-specific)